MRKSIYAITAVLLLLAAVGCDTTAGSGTGQGQDGLAVVSLAIAGTTAGRSVLPAQAKLEDAAKWRLLGGKTGETRRPLTALFSYPTNQTLLLATGDWDFTLEGYADESGETLILRETITGRRITLEGPNTLSFVVEPVLDETGDIDITINLPAGHGINRVEVFKDGEPLELEPPLMPDAQNNILFEQADHKAGDYYFSFRLFKDDDLYGVVSELVQVRLNLCSTAVFELKQEDLNLSYVIAYHLNVNKPDPDYYRRTDAALVLAEPDDRDGYEFDGWYDNDGLGGAPLAKLPTPVTGGNRDFYAQWEIINYPIDYVLGDEGSDNGGNLTTYTVESSEIILKKPNPNGKFLFLYWYAEGYPEKAVATIPAGSTGHKTFYAKWIPQHPIAFHPNGGNPPPETQYVAEGEEATKPGDMTKAFDLDDLPETAGLYTGLTFAGWHLDDPDGEEWDFNDPVAEPLELYAKWTAVPVNISQQTGNTMLNKALNYINALTLDDETPFAIVLDTDWSMGVYDDQRMASINKAIAVITLVGKGPDPTVIEGCLNATSFSISNGTLILDKNITIKGPWANSSSLVRVNSTGALIMKEGATITDNHVGGGNSSVAGVAVAGGSFFMDGGEISHNTSPGGGGVSVSNSGSFTMKGGTISHNSSEGSGGGVSVSSGSFDMDGGTISINSSGGDGGGVSVSTGGNFTMNNGTIFNNTAGLSGGGVFANGSFIMKDGTISGNTATGQGGGGVWAGGSFTMRDGEISGNSSTRGGGVYVNSSFTMEGGEISGNSSTLGGGVFFYWKSISFSKTGNSVIYGDNDNIPYKDNGIGNPTDNTAKAGNTNGHAVYHDGGYYRDAELGKGDDISTSDTVTNWNQ